MKSIIPVSGFDVSIRPFHKPIARMPILAFFQNNPQQTRKSSNSKILNRKAFFSALVSIPESLFTSFRNFVDAPLHHSVDPKHVFNGNYAPVDELDPTECQVIEGELPLSLNGVYIRNGPNPQHQARRALCLYDGDGMLHSLKLSNGHAIYCSRYVKTYKYMIESEAGFPIVPNLLSGFHGLLDIIRFVIATRRLVTGHLNLMKGIGVANTALAFLSNKLLAVCESDLPYLVDLTKEGDIKTIGRWDFDKKLFSNMTAHPKLDMVTKDTFAFSWSLTFPHLTLFSFNENGVKQNEVPITSINQPTFIHDFAITKRFVLFHETQIVISLPKLMLGRGTIVDYEPRKPSRIGVLPRHARNDSEMKWFEVPGLNAIHIINAWENGDDEIILVVPNVVSLESMENIFDRTVNIVLEKVSVNIETGKVSREILSTRHVELGSINTSYVGKKTRYAYLGVLEEVLKMSGVVKIDLETGIEVGRKFFEPGCFGGEPLFVRKYREDIESDEDDGYVMTYVHNENSNESKFIVMDAKDEELSIVAAVKLPRRVPYGFHGLFLNNEDLLHL